MPGDDEGDLEVPGRSRPDQAVVDGEARGAEEVPPVPERIGGERRDRLALEEEQGEVVGGHVGEGDRDERVGECAARPPSSP